MRYRKKLEKYTESCELENIQMRLEIGSLEQHRRYLMTTHDNIWYVATEYFRLFQYGYMKPTVSNASRTTPFSLSQQDFVSKVIASDVAFNARCGRERMMKQWKLLSQWFAGIEFNLMELKSISAGSLVAATITSITFTERTMHIVFPHLMSGKRRMLGEKLLNRRIVMHGSVRLVWSTTNCQIIGLFAESDMLTPVLRLLGNLQDTSYVFEKAAISPSFW
ncbi:hypothetical protein PHMEG_00019586 [Phytophthora megakarya]|uniref:Uncharacterized protein n=1 Tax=Phytophthora megakarya TaxID=4795 RepID=A0A225VSF5_9STRA|nr:hypothetical protein PHMEG_00019586 [Phytophthora megakarya]